MDPNIIIDLVFQTLNQLARQYPAAGWLSVIIMIIVTVCGLCSLLSMWLPVPKEPTGLYATAYKWIHALAAHFRQNKGAMADANSATVKAEIKAVTGK